ncbi:PEPxxWA-CTERM sorting domain-containing protein [Sphingomonas profundi]|uniref:PEPxxWA-CTERM sorting domain-containing protein n=1 Tax=Alterirhizorhabdus profundi TaxID=2681549 RepID=UPI001E2EE8B2|nr:PEPxxWA-CTERM sorting domain-containing protein [Sphingomonas profundi]
MWIKAIGISLAAFVAAAQPASAAVRLVSAAVTGASGTVWNTNNTDTFYTLFLQSPVGTSLNPNDDYSPFSLSTGSNNFLSVGDGFPTGAATNPAINSDLVYTMTLNLDNGMGGAIKTLTGDYNTVTNTFTSTSGPARFFGRDYTLDGFNYNRGRSNLVGAYSVASRVNPVGPGSTQDYLGDFNVASVAVVPESSTWAMMIGGFGFIGGALRRRRGLASLATA